MSNYNKLKRNIDIIILMLVLIIYGYYSIFLSVAKPLWRDEAFSSLIASQSITEIIQSTSSDFNPPLFYFLLHYWQLISTDTVFLRILPLVFSLLTIIVIYFTLPKIYKMKNKLYSWILLFFLISNGSIFYYSYELRPYSMLMLFSYLTFYAGLLYQKEQIIKHKVLLILSSVFLLYTQTMGIYFWVILSIIIIISLISKKDWKTLRRIMFLYLLISLLYLPWLYVIISQFQNFNNSFWLEFKPEEKLQNLSALFAFNEGPLHFDKAFYARIYQNIYNLLTVIVVFGLLKRGLTRFISVLIIINLVGLYYISYYKPLFYGRYFTYLSPLSSILMASLIYSIIFKKLKSKILNIIRIFFLGLILFYYFKSNYYLWNDYYLGVARVNYFSLKNIKLDNIYVTSDLDILPCMVYQSRCIYLKGKNEIKGYIGFLQLKNKKIIEDWNMVNGNKIGVVCRNVECNNALDNLNEKDYQMIDNKALGDGTKLMVFTKD